MSGNISGLEADSKQSLLITNQNSKYFLGDQKTFMKELKDQIDTRTRDLTDSSTDSMTLDGVFIPDKNQPGAIFLINNKLNDLKDMNQTLLSTFDFLKQIESDVSKLVQG